MARAYRTRDLSALTVEDLRKFVGSSWSRKLAHNTYVEQLPHGDIAIRFHATRILVFRVDGSFVVDTGGYHTVTTKQRLNALLPAGHRISQRAYAWFISTPEGDFPFEDGDRWGGPVRQHKPIPAPAPALDFGDVHYGDVRADDYVWDRSVSHWARVVEVVERNAVEVELRLWGGDSLVAELDTLIARKLPRFSCRFPHASFAWCGPFCENSAPDGTFETAEEREARTSRTEAVA